MARSFAFLVLISLAVDFSQADFIHEMEMNNIISDPSKFSWKSCSDGPDTLINVTELNISPDVIVSGKNETFSGTVVVKKDITESMMLSAKLSIKMKMGGEYKDLCPLFATMHLCDIDDICKMMAGFKEPCPSSLTQIGFQCRCPITEKSYKISKWTKLIPDLSGFNGSYDVTITIYGGGKVVGCLNLRFCLNQCSEDEDESILSYK